MLNPALRILSERYPTITSAASEVAALRASKELPKGVVHVISDVHGEYHKLRHVINNASGCLRPLVEEIFGTGLTAAEKQEFMNVLYYPAEVLAHVREELAGDDEARNSWVKKTLDRQFKLIRLLLRRWRRRDTEALAPNEYRELFEAMLNFPAGGHDQSQIEVQLRELAVFDLDFAAIRQASRYIRNLSVEELIVAGDLGDRGPRLDRVVDYLMRQPNVRLVFGNHDVSWMGACLGQRALIATVMRISLRYLRMFQVEEGYGLLTKALEVLAARVYGDDPAVHFQSKRIGQRDADLVARMQKAATVLQLKLEGQTIERHPEWGMDERNVLRQVDWEKHTIVIDGVEHSMRDMHLPTVDREDPNRLSDDEEECIQRLEQSFTQSPRLWEHMQWMAENGQMATVRDRAVIFHACMPVDEKGCYLPLFIDGIERRGPEMLEAFNAVIKRAFRVGSERVAADDLDWFYYLWAGPRSPLFGKDRMTTFESYFIEDKATHVETKGPWFQWIHDHAFCDRVARDMGVAKQGLLVNGHVPVKVDEGDVPLKKGGNAVTIDGAFSEAYGDRGFTLILEPEGETLAEHHTFPDPMTAVSEGIDIIPEMTSLRRYESPRKVGDTEKGRDIDALIEMLGELIEAYQNGHLLERRGG